MLVNININNIIIHLKLCIKILMSEDEYISLYKKCIVNQYFINDFCLIKNLKSD